MSEDEAKVYLGAIKESMNSPNMILDLRIPQNQKYQQVVLDEAISRFLAGEIDKEATVKAVDDGWNELNDEIGKDEQLKIYKATIGAQVASTRRQPGAVPARRALSASKHPSSSPMTATAADDRARTPLQRPELGGVARPPFRPAHGAAGRHRPALLCDLSADHLGLSGAVALRAGAGGFTLSFIGLTISSKLLSGSQQYHLLGTFGRSGIAAMGRPRRWSRRRCSSGFWPAISARQAHGRWARSGG